jgi:hypothetical protein
MLEKPPQLKASADLPSTDLGEFLNQHAVIRIALHVGRGYGHQAAGITLMHRLRELGYKGRFHILVPYWSRFDDRMGRNMAQLIPGYDYSNRGTQEVGSGEVDSAHRYVVQKHLKLAGAWWRIEHAKNMIKLITCRANDLWDAYWKQVT